MFQSEELEGLGYKIVSIVLPPSDSPTFLGSESARSYLVGKRSFIQDLQQAAHRPYGNMHIIYVFIF